MSVLGMECELYVNAGSEQTPDWQLCGCVRDLTVNRDSATADSSSRCSGGIRRNRSTLREFSLDFQLVYDKDDTNGYALLMADWMQPPASRVTRGFRVLSGAASDATTEGTEFTGEVANLTESQNLEDVVLADASIIVVDQSTIVWQTGPWT